MVKSGKNRKFNTNGLSSLLGSVTQKALMVLFVLHVFCLVAKWGGDALKLNRLMKNPVSDWSSVSRLFHDDKGKSKSQIT